MINQQEAVSVEDFQHCFQVGDFPRELSRFGFVSLFNGTSTFMGYLMPNTFLLRNNFDTI